jgi:hypothetical protein
MWDMYIQEGGREEEWDKEEGDRKKERKWRKEDHARGGTYQT